eukprot:NODE_279_length_1052_cov_83.477567_g237_i0.p1 GENE.NODE_279_length_1052_cov_83.477567_g237_i0~~NODE_279_length_1052_cov_83.477567_g237_i0.p1  ORF type:complete len:298 (-),score=44.61 NODE_279_length_1052_cov_83.477567_g237_i0:24-917(-)
MFENCFQMKKSGWFTWGKRKTRRNENRFEKPRMAREASLVLKQPITKRAKAELMLKKMPKVGDFPTAMNQIVYKSPIDQAAKDVLRLIRRVTLVKQSITKKESDINFSKDDVLPENLHTEESSTQSLYLFMVFVGHLLDHFEQDTGKETKQKLDELFKAGDLKVADILSLIGAESKTGVAIKCLNQAVVITGHTHIKCNVCPLPTRDLPGDQGWQILVTLNDYIQVKHTKREQNVQFPGDKDSWEVQFDVSLTFDRQMKEITNSSLAVTSLNVEDVKDQDFKEYLEEKFGNGDLLIC